MERRRIARNQGNGQSSNALLTEATRECDVEVGCGGACMINHVSLYLDRKLHGNVGTKLRMSPSLNAGQCWKQALFASYRRNSRRIVRANCSMLSSDCSILSLPPVHRFIAPAIGATAVSTSSAHDDLESISVLNTVISQMAIVFKLHTTTEHALVLWWDTNTVYNMISRWI